MKSDEQKLRDCFQALRSADASAAPSFYSLLHAPSKERSGKTADRGLSRVWLPFGAAAAAAAVLVFSFRAPETPAEDLSTADRLQAMCDWRPSTDTLLASATGLWDNSSMTDELMDNETPYREDRENFPDSRL